MSTGTSFRELVIVAFDPTTGQEFERYEIDSHFGVGVIGGLAFVDDTLYAIATDRFGIVDLPTGFVSELIGFSNRPCEGGSMGLDPSGSRRLFYTCNLGSAPGADSILGQIDLQTFEYHELGDIVPSATLDAIAVVPEPERAEIDIRPRAPMNVIAPFGRGVVHVAVLGSERVDVSGLDLATIRFGAEGAEPTRFGAARSFDVDSDGYPDLISRFRIRDTGIALGDREACLTVEDTDGVSFEGCDQIRTVPGCGHSGPWALLLPIGLVWRRRP